MPSTIGVTSSAFWTPLDLSPDLWLDASDTSTITSSSGFVSQWNDKSGLGRNVVQASAALQPVTGASTVNGRNVIDFAGDYMASSAAASTWTFLHDGTNYLVAAVAKFGTVANPNTRYTLLATYWSSDSNRGAFILWDDRSSVSRNNTLATRVSIGNASVAAVGYAASNDVAAANTPLVVTALLDPDNAVAADRGALFVNNGAALKGNTLTGTPSATAPNQTLHIGSFALGEVPHTGNIAEILIVKGANATESNRVALRNYLAAKWGIY